MLCLTTAVKTKDEVIFQKNSIRSLIESEMQYTVFNFPLQELREYDAFKPTPYFVVTYMPYFSQYAQVMRCIYLKTHSLKVYHFLTAAFNLTYFSYLIIALHSTVVYHVCLRNLYPLLLTYYISSLQYGTLHCIRPTTPGHLTLAVSST